MASNVCSKNSVELLVVLSDGQPLYQLAIMFIVRFELKYTKMTNKTVQKLFE